MLSIAEFLESAGGGVALSILCTYLFARRKGAEALDAGRASVIAERDARVTEQAEAITQLNQTLSKPKRTPFEEQTFHQVKEVFGGCSRDEITVLRLILLDERMTTADWHETRPTAPPHLRRSADAEKVLERLASIHLVARHDLTIPNGREEAGWTIPGPIASPLKELLLGG